MPALVFEGLPPALTATNIAGYLWLAIPGTLVAYLFWFRGILALPPARVTLLGFLAPLVATLLGWIVLDQTLAPLQWLGAAAIVASVVLGARGPKRVQVQVPDTPAGLTTKELVG